ncbi:MAG TPA: acyltransferase [Burkholderiales bacterium]|nr:acyltransferase [Burkholderiales bacterium]
MPPPNLALDLASPRWRSLKMQVRYGNSYDFVRFLAASAVLFSHHFALSGLAEPPVPGYGEDFGKLGVEVFFCLSGFLICRSLQRSGDWAEFASARVLRILPNLAFALIVTSSATLVYYGNYANVWPHVKYVARNLLMFLNGVAYEIPGVFADALKHAVNGPLWSLPHELWAYVLLFVAFALGARHALWRLLFLAAVFSLIWGLTPVGESVRIRIGGLDSFQFSRLGSFFFSGALLAFARRFLEARAVLLGLTALPVLVLLRAGLPVDTLLQPLTLALAVIGLGSSKAMARFSAGGDASYGMYIFAWPIQQFSILLIPDFWTSMLVAFVATVAVGYATWHAFERRTIACRSQLAMRLRRAFALRKSPVV